MTTSTVASAEPRAWAAPPGWYFPAADRPTMRFWDGSTWTDHVADLPPPTIRPVPRARSVRRPLPLVATWWVWVLAAGVAVCAVMAWDEASGADAVTTPSTVISPPSAAPDAVPPQATFFP